jgi:hypothetical protein
MSDSIDSNVVLGLAGKMSQIFAEPGTYLSFPLAAIGWEKSTFHALAADPLSQVGQQALAEFSLLVNELPNGPLWQVDSSSRLWDVYGDVLADVDLAQSTRTPAEDADYQRAYALLYQIQPDGTVIDSPAVIAYQQYRDAFITATLEYNNRRGQAEISADAALKAQWAKDEPVLKQHVTSAEQEWTGKGHRSEVDAARQTLRDIGSKSPETVWTGYRKLFDPNLPEIFYRTTIDGMMYVPSSYMPSNATDIAWPSVNVARSELATLANAAPPLLRSRLAGGSLDAAVEFVSFEYSAATTTRGWLAPEVFSSDSWRFYDPNRVLCDGGTPPKGECTAYVAGVVLARNISVHRQTPAANANPAINLGFLPTSRSLAPIPITKALPKEAVLQRIEARNKTELKSSVMKTALVAGVAAPAIAPTPAAIRPALYAASVSETVNESAIVARGLSPVLNANTESLTMLRPERPNGDIIIRERPIGGIITKGPLIPPPKVPPPPPSISVTTTDPNHIYILAFICRTLPKSPNPNPALKW